MKLFGLELKFPWEVKASATQPLVMLQFTNQSWGVYMRRNPAQFADQGYRRNIIAYKAISTVARSAACIPLRVKLGEKLADETHPLCRLLKRPNPWQGGAALIESLVAYYMIAGNTYLEGVGAYGEGISIPRELYAVRPDRMRVVPGKVGVAGFVYEVNGQTKKWQANEVTGESPILHMKSFNPTDDIYGLSPMEAAAYSVDSHNSAGMWNQSLLQNAARPSGALVYAPSNGGTPNLTDKQFERLREEINSQYSGGKNAGRPMILEGGLDWRQMSLSPADMDWINGKHVSAREIALAFGVPPQMLGIPGDNTYSNYQEARQAFYEDTVVPLLDSFLDNINNWLGITSEASGENEEAARIEMNLDDVPAFALKRKERIQMVQSATWMTINEKRKAAGLEPVDEPLADEVMMPGGLVPLSQAAAPPDESEQPKPGEKKALFDWLGEVKYSPDQPRDDRGRWTDGSSEGARVNLAEARRLHPALQGPAAPPQSVREAVKTQAKVQMKDFHVSHPMRDRETGRVMYEKTLFKSEETLQARIRDQANVLAAATGDDDVRAYVTMHPDGSVTLSMNTRDDSTITRSFAPDGTVYHDTFTIEGETGRGAARLMMRDSIESYEQMGVKTVKVAASLKSGGYVWARAGFEPTTHDREKLVANALRTISRLEDGGIIDTSVSVAMRSAAREVGAGRMPMSDFATAASQIKLQGGERRTLGSDIFAGSRWDGHIDMSNAEQMKRVKAFYSKK